MAIDFPDSPVLDQQFTVGETTWYWNGSVWRLLISEGVQGDLGPTGPTGPVSTQPGPTGATGPTGPENDNVDGGAPNSVYGGGITLNGGNVLGV
jgi:hypothetical protein